MSLFMIYIVDDEIAIRKGISFILKHHHKLQTFTNAEHALEMIRQTPPDLILLDIRLPGMSGLEALRHIKRHHPDIPVIMITASNDIATAIAAMKAGAYDYVLKPLQMELLRKSIDNALKTISLRKQVHLLQEKLIKENLPCCFISKSNAVGDMMKFVNKIAKSPDTPVLISGESGTGKEIIASAIHYKSPNYNGPFVKLNCAALPHDLIESELFGYEKGAFSGALTAGKRGLLEEADGGTLFLDEIGEMSLVLQAKLLRFLEEGEYYRVGGTRPKQVKTRIVSATNRNIETMIENNGFRLDLYYRIAALQVTIPALNERPEDILPIARYFLVKYNRKFGKAFTDISSSAEYCLTNQNWRGNIRELRNVIERAVLVGTPPEILPDDLGFIPKLQSKHRLSDSDHAAFPPLPENGIDLKEMEKFYIRQACKIAEGNDAKAAQLLHMSYYSFRYRKKKLSNQSI